MSKHILSRMFSRQMIQHEQFAVKSLPGSNLGGRNVRHFSFSRSAWTKKTTQDKMLVVGGFMFGGSLALAAATYRRNLPAFLDAVSLSVPGKGIPQAILKRSLCAQARSSEVRDMCPEDLPGWTPESLELYNSYAAELYPRGWKKVLTSVGRERNQALFTLNHPDIGATFEYVIFYNEEEQRSITLMQFGPKTQGPPGFVHGGAIATAGDACAGILLFSGMHITCVTASLTVNYKRPIPLGSAVVVETKIEKVDGRKYYTISTFKSPDGSILYDTVNTLFIQISSPPK